MKPPQVIEVPLKHDPIGETTPANKIRFNLKVFSKKKVFDRYLTFQKLLRQ